MAYKTIWEEKGIRWVFSDSLTNDDLLSSNRELYIDDRFPLIEYQICDFNAVTEFPVDPSNIRFVAEMDANYYEVNPNIKVAIVANKKIVTELAKIYKSYFELAGNNTAWDIDIFETSEAARKWVDVSRNTTD